MTQSNWPFVPVRSAIFDGLEIVRADGPYIYSSDGQEILDASAGAAVGNIGWGRQEVADAAAESLSRLCYALPPFATPERIALVDRLAEHWLPDGIHKVSFFGSGSEANDAAMRLARQYQLARGEDSRFKVIGRDVSYNGTSIATLAVGGHDARRHGFEPLMRDMPHAPAVYCLRCPLGQTYPACQAACADELEALILREGPETIAAFLAEPINGTSAGGLTPPDEYWPKVRDICTRHGILLIADEVLTGFGRTGRKFALQHWDTEPDIVVLGKGMGGGYAGISGLAVSDRVIDTLVAAGSAPMFHTYSGHPVQCAASNKVLEIMQRENLVERVAELAPALEKRMRQLESNPWVADVRGRGFLWGIEVVRDKSTLERFDISDAVTFRLMEATTRRGVYTYFGGTGTVRDVINVAPHFIIDESHMDRIVETIDAAVTEVCETGS